MRKRRWRLLWGLGLVFLAAGVTWAKKDGWREQQFQEYLLRRDPSPPPPAERAQRVRSAIATLKEMCTAFRQERLESHEFARRFGTIEYDSQVELGQYYHLSFRPHNPVLQTSLGADVYAADEHWEAGEVSFDLPDSTLITLADLEPVFGPGRILDVTADPLEDVLEVYFRWEPPAPGYMHCRIFASIQHLDLLTRFDEKTGLLWPSVDRERIRLNHFQLDRGTVEDNGRLLYPQGAPVRASTPHTTKKIQAQR